MPSLIEYFGHTITNFGPLTTTYTLPASCTTQTAGRIIFANATSISQQFGKPECRGGYVGDCYPSGEEYDKYVDAYWEGPVQAWYPYHSPGLVCPSGWSMVGTLAHAGNTSSFDASGVFTQDPYKDLPARARTWVGAGQVWSNALRPSETLAYCCPSGYSGVIGGGCYSSIGPLESLSYTEVCRDFYPDGALTTVGTVEGSPVTQGVYSVVPVTETYSRETAALTTLQGEPELEDWAVVSVYPAVALVYQETDVAKAKKKGGESDDKDDDEKKDSESSAARGLIPVLAAAAGMLVGVGLLVAW